MTIDQMKKAYLLSSRATLGQQCVDVSDDLAILDGTILASPTILTPFVDPFFEACEHRAECQET